MDENSLMSNLQAPKKSRRPQMKISGHRVKVPILWPIRDLTTQRGLGHGQRSQGREVWALQGRGMLSKDEILFGHNQT